MTGRDPRTEKTRQWRRAERRRSRDRGRFYGCTCGYCMSGFEKRHKLRVGGFDDLAGARHRFALPSVTHG